MQVFGFHWKQSNWYWKQQLDWKLTNAKIEKRKTGKEEIQLHTLHKSQLKSKNRLDKFALKISM